MKKLSVVLSVLLIAALLACSVSAAFGETAKLRSTQTFLDFCDAKGIKYTLDTSASDDKYEVVRISYSLDNFESLRCTLLFKTDNEEVGLRIWNIVTTTASKDYVLYTINKINADYKFAKYVLDESDMTVQVELDVYIEADSCGRVVYDSMMALFNITDRDDVASALKMLQ